MPEPPRVEVALRPRARQDLTAIYDHSRATFGEPTAELYVAALFEAFETLASHPSLGVACDEIRDGYRRLPVGKHHIFYRLEAQRVDVVRILHQRMLPAALDE